MTIIASRLTNLQQWVVASLLLAWVVTSAQDLARMAVLALAVAWIWVVDSDITIIMVGQGSEVEALGVLEAEAASEGLVGVVDLDTMEVALEVLVVALEAPAVVVALVVVLVVDMAEALVDGKQAHLSKDALIHSLISKQTPEPYQEAPTEAMKQPTNRAFGLIREGQRPVEQDSFVNYALFGTSVLVDTTFTPHTVHRDYLL